MTGKISSILCTALLLTGLSVSVSQPAVRCDPWKLAEKFREELPRLGNQSWSKKQVGDYFWKHATDAFGVDQNLISFFTDATGGQYRTQVQYLIDNKIWTRNRLQPATDRISEAMGHIGTTVAALTIISDAAKAIEGDKSARLKALAGTVNLQRGWLLKKIGSTSLNVAMFTVFILEYSLQKFISETLAGHEDYWWNAYLTYYEKKYPNLVKGSRSWATLYKEQGEAGIKRRLNEFWDNPYDNAVKYPMKNPPPLYIKEPGERLKKLIPVRYCRDYVYPTLKTWATENWYNETARLALEIKQTLCLELELALRELQKVKSELEKKPDRKLKLGALTKDDCPSPPEPNLYLSEADVRYDAEVNCGYLDCKYGLLFNGEKQGPWIGSIYGWTHVTLFTFDSIEKAREIFTEGKPKFREQIEEEKRKQREKLGREPPMEDEWDESDPDALIVKSIDSSMADRKFYIKGGWFHYKNCIFIITTHKDRDQDWVRRVFDKLKKDLEALIDRKGHEDRPPA